MEGPKKYAAHTRGHTPRLRFESEEDMVQGKDDLSEIPCLVTGLPASRAISMKNPAYNGEVQDLFWIIPWEVTLREIETLTP